MPFVVRVLGVKIEVELLPNESFGRVAGQIIEDSVPDVVPRENAESVKPLHFGYV